MYVSEDEKEDIAEDLAELLHQETLLVAFARKSAALYDDYGEYEADDIMRKVKKKFLQKNSGRQ